jgi:integrase/recombinase XerD
MKRNCPPAPFLSPSSRCDFCTRFPSKRDWSFEDAIPAPKKPQRLPVVLSPEEVLHFLSCVGSTKHRAILTTCDAAGLRISEAIRLKLSSPVRNARNFAGFVVEALAGTRYALYTSF